MAPHSPFHGRPVGLEEYVEDLKANIGHVQYNTWSPDVFGPNMPGPHHPYISEISLDALRKYVDAVGDLNPIYRDQEYAMASKYGQRIAPPTMLYAFGYGHYPNPKGYPPLPNFGGVYAGDTYEWFDVIREGDQIDLKTITPVTVQLKQTKMAGPMGFYTGEHEFRRKGSYKKIAQCSFTVGLKEGEPGDHRPPAEPIRHSRDYIEQVYAAQDAETVRGALPRYWEEVEIGDELAPVVRGPFTQMEAVAWYSSAIGERFFLSDRMFRFMHDHCKRGVWDEDLQIWKNWHDESLGLGTLGSGSQRSAWVAMMLTNWMGDDGFLRKMTTRHVYPGRYGNVYWCSGKVVAKAQVDGFNTVEVECKILSQTGQLHLTGTATLHLPSRANPAQSTVPAEREHG